MGYVSLWIYSSPTLLQQTNDSVIGTERMYGTGHCPQRVGDVEIHTALMYVGVRCSEY